jgi:hypothetical protein
MTRNLILRFALGALGMVGINCSALSQSVAPEPAVAAPLPRSRLISQSQYVNALHMIFGQDITVPTRLPPVKRVGGLLSLGASQVEMTPAGLDAVVSGADAISAQVVDESHREYLIPCKPKSKKASDSACATKFFASIGPYLFRRPLTGTELGLYVDLASKGTGVTHDFYTGLAMSLSGMLISPKFLVINDVVGFDRDGNPSLDEYSRATRLSLLLWNSFPDNELLQAAKKGGLHKPADVARQVQRMMESPQLEEGVRAFFEDMMNLELMDTIAKDSTIYPAFSRRALEASKEQVLRIIADHVVVHDADYRQLFTTKKLYVNGDLSPLYQLAVVDPAKWTEFMSADNKRSGLLTQIAFLSTYSQPGRSSPTKRGRGLREVFLCQHVPDPPPNVKMDLDNPSHRNQTARERLAAHATNPICAGCHKLTDPIGLGLEHFDGAGQWRDKEGESVIDATGTLNGVSYDGAEGLGQVIAKDPSLPLCVTQRLTSYALNRESADKEIIKYFGERFANSGYRLKALIGDIATSKAFFAVAGLNAMSTAQMAAAEAPVK